MSTQVEFIKTIPTNRAESASRCDKCGEIVADIDAGFSPGLQAMTHDCGGKWRRITFERGTGAWWPLRPGRKPLPEGEV